MITSYKIRDINRNPELHKEAFVLKSDCEQLLEKFVSAALVAGADFDTMMGSVEDE